MSFHIRGNSQFPRVVVRNTGNAPVGSPFQLSFASGSKTITHTVTMDSAAMKALNGTDRGAEVPLASWGSWNDGEVIVGTVDSGKAIAELREDNNTFSQKVGVDECMPVTDFIVPPADLVLTAVKDPAKASMRVTVRNLGGPASFFMIETKYAGAASQLFGTTGTSYMVAGNYLTALNGPARQVELDIGVLYNPKFEYTVTVRADSRCQVDETNEANNAASLTLNAGKAPPCAPWPACNSGTVCTPGALTCTSQQIGRWCAANGSSWTEFACEAGTHCSNGQCVGN